MSLKSRLSTNQCICLEGGITADITLKNNTNVISKKSPKGTINTKSAVTCLEPVDWLTSLINYFILILVTIKWREPGCSLLVECLLKGAVGHEIDPSVDTWKEMFYLTTHSIHFIYGYMASDIWLRTIHDSERGNPLPPHGLLFPINSKGSLIAQTTAFVTPVVEYWLE